MGSHDDEVNVTLLNEVDDRVVHWNGGFSNVEGRRGAWEVLLQEPRNGSVR